MWYWYWYWVFVFVFIIYVIGIGNRNYVGCNLVVRYRSKLKILSADIFNINSNNKSKNSSNNEQKEILFQEQSE